MRKQGIEALQRFGPASGLTPEEITDIERLIREKTQALVEHIRDYESGRDPIRVAYLAMINLRGEKRCWWKPWIDWRFQKIVDRWCDMWYKVDRRSGVATRYVPEAT